MIKKYTKIMNFHLWNDLNHMMKKVESTWVKMVWVLPYLEMTIMDIYAMRKYFIIGLVKIDIFLSKFVQI